MTTETVLEPRLAQAVLFEEGLRHMSRVREAQSGRNRQVDSHALNEGGQWTIGK